MQWTVGRVRITKVVELETIGSTRFILPLAGREEILQLPWLIPHFATAEGRLKMSIHALVLETPPNVTEGHPFAAISELIKSGRIANRLRHLGHPHVLVPKHSLVVQPVWIAADSLRRIQARIAGRLITCRRIAAANNP